MQEADKKSGGGRQAGRLIGRKTHEKMNRYG